MKKNHFKNVFMTTALFPLLVRSCMDRGGRHPFSHVARVMTGDFRYDRIVA